VALIGVSLAWLMAKPGNADGDDHSADRKWDRSFNRRRGYVRDYGDDYDWEDYDDEIPLGTISGSSLRRTGSSMDEGGRNYSEFTDDAGKKFRVMSDESGKRAGHFIDEAGNRFRGFTDSAGRRIEHFQDEAGNLLDEAMGWASHTWRKARRRLHDARDAVGSRAGMFSSRAGEAGGALRSQTGRLNETIVGQFRDQPLVGGALAFAIGAALGAALPRTPQEDELMGEAADVVKAKAGEQAAGIYEQGKEQATKLYDKATEKASELLDEAKEGMSNSTEGTRARPMDTSGSTPQGTARY
jgi:cell division septum initiation protein DivIVA